MKNKGTIWNTDVHVERVNDHKLGYHTAGELMRWEKLYVQLWKTQCATKGQQIHQWKQNEQCPRMGLGHLLGQSNPQPWAASAESAWVLAASHARKRLQKPWVHTRMSQFLVQGRKGAGDGGSLFTMSPHNHWTVRGVITQFSRCRKPHFSEL